MENLKIIYRTEVALAGAVLARTEDLTLIVLDPALSIEDQQTLIAELTQQP